MLIDRLSGFSGRAALILLLAPAAATAQEELYCPWADTVVRISISDDGRLASISDASGSIRFTGALPVTNSIKQIGAAKVPVVSFVLAEGAYFFHFELQRWEKGGVELRNFRYRPSDSATWEEQGSCFSNRTGDN